MESKENEMMSVIIDLISRVSVLENLLLNKGMITQSEVSEEMDRLGKKLSSLLEKNAVSEK